MQSGLKSLSGAGGQLGGMLGGGLGGAVSGISSALGSLAGAINPLTLGFGALLGATKGLYECMNYAVQVGMKASQEAEKLNAQLSKQLGAQGINGGGIVDKFLKDAENGVMTAQQMTDIFTKLIPTLNGDTDGALKLIERLHDLEAATGVSGANIAQLIGRIK